MQTRTIDARGLGLSGGQLYELAGELPPTPRLAIVGSRAAHRRYRALVPDIVGVLAEGRWSVVSGGAIGIDGDAHRAALASDTPQLVILPCGPDNVYPSRHRPLFEQVAVAPRSGLLFAQRWGTRPARGMFASRNALVVKLSQAVIVVEAGMPSGTLITATLARRYGIPLAAVHGSPGAAAIVGSGARVLRAEHCSADTASWLRSLIDGRNTAARPPWPLHLRPLCQQLQRHGERGVTLDDLVSTAGGAGALLEAEALGLVVEVAPGRYVAVDRTEV